MDYTVWTNAYGQIFFTLSICFAIMITYSSYLPEKSDINNNGMMAAFINCGFSMLAGIMVFGVLGYMAGQQDVAIKEVVDSGVGLAFVTIPKAINLLPASGFFGFLFFLALVCAGLSSMISITEACCSGLMDKFGSSRAKTSTSLVVVGFLASLVFMTNGGLFVLDIVDHFINNFGIVLAGLVEVILISWFFNLSSLKDHINKLSDFRVGAWWSFCLKVVTPIVLGYMAIANLVGDITSAYGDYPITALVLFGWCAVILVIVVGVFIQATKSAWENES